MYRHPITRSPRETHDDRRTTARRRRGAWAWLAAPHATPPSAVSETAVAECRCPTDCIRDHEYE